LGEVTTIIKLFNTQLRRIFVMVIPMNKKEVWTNNTPQ